MMDVEDLLNIVKNLPDDYYGVGIFSVDSWRGRYYEPAFELVEFTTKKQMLAVINECIGGTFTGYKGGEYTYWSNDPVNFDEYGVYSDGEYFENWVESHPDNIFLQEVSKFFEKD